MHILQEIRKNLSALDLPPVPPPKQRLLRTRRINK